MLYYILEQFLIFLSLKGKIAFLDEAATSIPGRNIIDVRQHEKWYQEYLSLMEKKKDAIQKWKIVKEVCLVE